MDFPNSKGDFKFKRASAIAAAAIVATGVAATTGGVLRSLTPATLLR